VPKVLLKLMIHLIRPIIRLLFALLKDLLSRLDKASLDLPGVAADEVSKISASEGSPISLKRIPEEDAEVAPKPIRFRRPTYAQAQSEWEWAHNKEARDIVERAKGGFF
jgi:hypothetical protein